MTISTLIVGLGRVGMAYDLHLDPREHVYSHARATQGDPRFALLAGVDPRPEARSTFTRAYAAPAYTDLESALGKHRPDLIIIAVPTGLHAQTVRTGLEHGAPRMVLCEKPLSLDVAEARSIVEMCAGAGVKLYVNYMRRSDPGVVEVKRRITDGRISSPTKGIVWYSKGFFHTGSHFFNLLEYWLGPSKGSGVLNRGRSWEGVDPEPDVRVSFERGTVLFLAAWEERFSHYTVELLCGNGRLRYERGGEAIEWQQAERDPHFPSYTVLSEKTQVIHSGLRRYQAHVMEQIARAWDGPHAELCTGEDALHTLEQMTLILRAE